MKHKGMFVRVGFEVECSMTETLPIFDAWVQHPTPELLRSPMLASLLRWLHVEQLPEEIPLAMTTAALRSSGVKKALLTAWVGPEGALISNDQVAQCMKEEPDLYLGAASVDLRYPMEAVRELRRCVNELGFKALRIMPWWWGWPPNDRRYYPLYAACVDLGIPFCLQVGHAGPLRASEPGRPIPYLDEVALDFPELTIVAGHTGYPWTQEMISLATKYPNVYIDTSAYKAKRYPPELVQYMKRHGRKKVLFGSDHPVMVPSVALEGLEPLELDADVTRMFLYENAERVFGVSVSS